MSIEKKIDNLTDAINNLAAVISDGTINALPDITMAVTTGDAESLGDNDRRYQAMDAKTEDEDAELEESVTEKKSEAAAKKKARAAKKKEAKSTDDNATVDPNQHTVAECQELAKSKVAELGTSVRGEIKDVTKKFGGDKIKNLSPEGLNKFYDYVNDM